MPVVLTPAAVWFGAVVAFAFLFTFDKTFRALFAPLMTRIADIGFGGIRGHGSVHPFGFLNGIVDDVETWTRRQMAACERAMAWAIETMRATAHELSLTVHSMAENYKAAFDNVWHAVTHDAPKIIRQAVVRPVQKAAAYSDAKLRAQVHRLTVRVDHLAARVAHTATATAGAIAAPFPRLGRLERSVKAQGKRLTRLEKSTLGVVAAGFGVAVLAKAVIGWLRCPSLAKNLKKRHCIDSDLLDALLTGTLLIVGTISLVEFAKEVGAVTEEANGLIHGFLRDV